MNDDLAKKKVQLSYCKISTVCLVFITLEIIKIEYHKGGDKSVQKKAIIVSTGCSNKSGTQHF